MLFKCTLNITDRKKGSGRTELGIIYIDASDEDNAKLMATSLFLDHNNLKSRYMDYIWKWIKNRVNVGIDSSDAYFKYVEDSVIVKQLQLNCVYTELFGDLE
jgi:hypothetical protein